jgi:3',5'-cyclic AMP phosphodiesterase CpdA
MMKLNFRFAIVSDPHIALSHTIWDHPSRFHLVEVSIPALEKVFQHLLTENLDFLLLPGDLTQHGEPENHAWLANRLCELPFPAYVVPGNHDVPAFDATPSSIAFKEFAQYYHRQGYTNSQQPYYTCEVLPGVRLIGLNSNQFDAEGKQLPVGLLDEPQLAWLETVLAEATEPLVMIMVHHNVLEHLPNQSVHPLGRRYMLKNAPALLSKLKLANVPLIFTGHLHVQDIASASGLYDITTGSLVSYPHPYRVLEFQTDEVGKHSLNIKSHYIHEVPGWPSLANISREWMGERSHPFMMRLLTEPPLNLVPAHAESLAASLRYFWADIARGDAIFEFPSFPGPVRRYFEAFSAAPSDFDNNTVLEWHD